MREKDLAMRERADTQNREVVEVRSLLRGKGKIRTFIDDHMFDLMVGSQAVVDCPTWWGEYLKRKAEGLPETDCVRMAYDAVIQAQGGGQTKDLPDALRGSQLKRVFTAFSGYFVRTHNIAATKWGARMRKQNIGVPDVADVFAVIQSSLQVFVDFLPLYNIDYILGLLKKKGDPCAVQVIPLVFI